MPSSEHQADLTNRKHPTRFSTSRGRKTLARGEQSISQTDNNRIEAHAVEGTSLRRSSRRRAGSYNQTTESFAPKQATRKRSRVTQAEQGDDLRRTKRPRKFVQQPKEKKQCIDTLDTAGLSPTEAQRIAPASRHHLPKKNLQGDSEARAKELRELTPHPQPVQTFPTPPAPISQPAVTKRKRPQDSEAEAEAEADELEDVRPSKKSRGPPSSEHKRLEENLGKDFAAEANEQYPPPSKYQLSKENLQILNGGNMDTVASSVSTLKRTSSRRSIVPSETETERTGRSSSTTAFYRQNNLEAVEIHVHAEPPDYIRAAIDRIISTEVSQDRRSELYIIAQKFRDGCFEHVRALAGEDDFLNPLYIALKDLGFKNLCTHQKADWRTELKPRVPQPWHFSSAFMFGVQQLEVDDVPPPPPKPQQQCIGEPYMSPESSMMNAPARAQVGDSQGLSTMPPPVPSTSWIKTPRPDITMGIQYAALISALAPQILNKVQAKTFLTWLENEMVQHEPNRPLEPMLIPVPALRALDLAFPFAVVEGKAYSTGKQIFEAENQAAVSGACGLKIQLDLDDLVNRSVTNSDSLSTTSKTEPPLFFTICTQGPIHELWVHWTLVRSGVRMFGSKLLDSCNVLLLKQAEDFVVHLNKIGVWGLGPFMESVVKRLGIVAAKSTA